LRGGYELISQLGKSEKIPAVLAITDDLGKTLDKLPAWQKLEIDEEIVACFRGEVIKKEIYFNAHPKVKDLMVGLLIEYMNQQTNNNWEDEDDDDDWEEESDDDNKKEDNDEFEDVG